MISHRSSHSALRALLACMLVTAFIVSASAQLTMSQIQSNIQAIINNSNSNVQWSVLIENQWGTATYFSLNADTPRRPASNTKIFTTAAALGLKGPTYVWRGYQLQSSSTANPVEAVLSNSDNTLADELYGIVGGGSAVINWCSARGINMTGAQMYDGSGLNYSNRFTSRQTLQLVRYMMNNYSYSQWATHLAIACTKGTIASRMCSTSSTSGYTTGRVHAKTGTLTNGLTLSLSGYIDNYYDGQRYYFSIYTNNVPSTSQSDTRNRIDLIVREMGKSGIPNPGASQPIIVDNTSTGAIVPSTAWFTGTSVAGYLGSNYHARATGSVSDPFVWRATLPADGTYRVSARWTAASNRATAAPYQIIHAGGTTTVNVNQQQNNGQWVVLGTFQMYQGTADRVRLSCWTTSGQFVIADAVRFERQ